MYKCEECGTDAGKLYLIDDKNICRRCYDNKCRIIIKNKKTGAYHDTNITTALSFFTDGRGRLYARITTIDIDNNRMNLDILADRLIKWVDWRLKPAMKSLVEMKELRKKMFMEDGKTPRCHYCKGPMHNYTPTKGKFKGQLQMHCWVCDCPDFRRAGIILSVG